MTLSKRMFRYEGLSMWPYFQEGDLLELAAINLSQVRIGDCVAYQSTEGRQAVHRVIGKGSGLITRGDALAEADHETVQSDQIIGRAVVRHRLGRESYISRGLRGRFAGIFFRYAGRLDPRRSSRGGRLARLIRTICSRVFKIVRYQGAVRSMTLNGGEKITVCEVGGRMIGRWDSLQPVGMIAWPWSIFIDVPKKSC